MQKIEIFLSQHAIARLTLRGAKEVWKVGAVPNGMGRVEFRA